MRKTALIFLLLASAFSAMALQKKKKKAISPNEIISITMHRTVCFGRCPEYKIELTKDGMATYTGMRFADDTGIFKKNVGATKVKALFKQFQDYRVDTCSERYETRIPDVPNLNYTIKYANRTQTIRTANFGPKFLSNLATEMDGIGKKNGKGWKKTGMPKFD